MTSAIYKRILLKISGEALGSAKTGGIDNERLESYCREIIAIRALGVEVGIVIGGGNILRGAHAAGKSLKRATADYMGMLATVMNGIALKDFFEALGQPTRVLSALEVPRVCEPFIRLRAMRHLEKGRVVVFCGGTGNPFFTTDTTAALRGVEIEADVVMKATQVDGVYDKDPKRHPDAKKYLTLSYDLALKERLKIMDAAAFSICRENNLPILVFNMHENGNMMRAVQGEPIGTIIRSQE